MYLSFEGFAALILVAILGGVFTLTVLVTALIYETRLKLLEDSHRHAELKHLLVRADLARLQAQMRPHFIFNALNSVARLIDMNRLDQASRAVVVLGELLRHATGQSRLLVTLRDEIRLVEDYLAIQTLRFGDRVTVNMELPEQLMDVLLPALSIQALVENAFNHGVENGRGHVAVSIRAWRDGATVTIEVADNGIGISTEALAAFLA